MEESESPRRIKRRLRLGQLLSENGGAAQVARECGTPKSHFSAVMAGKRGLGDTLTHKLETLYSKPSGWFDSGSLYEAAYQPSTPSISLDGGAAPQINERRAQRAVPIESAVEVIANHLSGLEGYDKPTVISLLTALVNSPDMHAVVAAGLKTLKPQVRGDPAKHHPPAQKVHSSRTA